MRSISYRAKLRLRKILKISLIVLSVLLIVSIVGFVYLQRFLVYTPDGVRLDFSQSEEPKTPAGTDAPTHTVPDINIIYGEATPDIDENTPISGYYIDIAMLQDPDAVYDAVLALEGPGVVMIDLKSSSGMFYYSTGIEGAPLAEVDVATIDAVIAHLRTHGFTVIARVETFRDRAYALEHLSSGLAIHSGALWSDEGYYWLDPGDPTVIEYLQQIVKDLSSRGITEVVFDDFYYPSSADIIYKHDISRTELMNNAAASLLNYFTSTNITISFCNTASDLKVGNSRSHIMIENADASKVSSLLAAYESLKSPETQLVFLTGSKDTRFDGCSTLRPLIQD